MHDFPPKIVGALNITPDSFSDGGVYLSPEKAIKQARELKASGADLLDVGAEASGPGSRRVSAEDEWSRLSEVLPELSAVSKLSIDTYKSQTAERALSLGATVINDISAMRADPEMASLIASSDCKIVLMYSKENDFSPHVSMKKAEYADIIETISSFLDQRIEYALKLGVSEKQIILDPGMGRYLSTNSKYSWEVLRRLSELKEKFSQYPIIVGTSRKGFLGGELQGRDPLSQLSGLAAALNGASLIRTHNVQMANEFFSCWQRIYE